MQNGLTEQDHDRALVSQVDSALRRFRAGEIDARQRQAEVDEAFTRYRAALAATA